MLLACAALMTVISNLLSITCLSVCHISLNSFLSCSSVARLRNEDSLSLSSSQKCRISNIPKFLRSSFLIQPISPVRRTHTFRTIYDRQIRLVLNLNSPRNGNDLKSKSQVQQNVFYSIEKNIETQ